MSPAVHPSSKKISLWLFLCAFMVLAMAFIGAITRLTESGLSMVEWRPLIGTLPPLNQEEWQRVFDLYQTSPEYLHKNFGMTLDEFKNIFFWEWFHRLWGRLIGIVFFIPFIWFFMTKQIPSSMKGKVFIAFILGGLQGLMGWYMVKSGLVDMPAVSHYRLAAHLLLALLIFIYLLWLALDFRTSKLSIALSNTQRKSLWIGIVLLTTTIFFGALTAGKDAGLIYNSFPLMGGNWIPTDMWFIEPWYKNFFENHASIQFTHRWIAITSVVYILAICFQFLKHHTIFIIMAIIALLQMSLGIATLILQVPVLLASLHQLGAFITVGLLATIIHQSKKA